MWWIRGEFDEKQRIVGDLVCFLVLRGIKNDKTKVSKCLNSSQKFPWA